MKREPYLRWHPTPHESLNRYTMEVLHEHASIEDAVREMQRATRRTLAEKAADLMSDFERDYPW